MSRPGRVLIVVWAAGGNVLPAAGLARALVARGHEVRVLGPPVLRDRFKRGGSEFCPFERAQQPHLMEEEVYDDNLLAWTRFLTGKRLAEDVSAELQRKHADVVVVDAFLPAGLCAAEREGIPAVALLHVLYQPSVSGDIAEQWDSAWPMVSTTRARLGLAPLESSSSLISALWSKAAAVLVCVPQSFDYESPEQTANVHYVGPIFDDPPGKPTGRDGSAVLVSFSTTDMRQAGAVQRSLDALSGLDVRVVCTLGGVRVDGLRIPPNATVFDWLPHSEILPRTSLVVTHAGLSTVMTSLAAGVPLVCLPMGRDQPHNAERVSALGLGVSVGYDADANDVEAACAEVLGSPAFAKRACLMAGEIAGYGNGARAVSEIESLL